MKENKKWIITLFILGIILLITAIYNIGYFQGQMQESWRYTNDLRECSVVIEQVKDSQKALEEQYDASLEALNISNSYNENQTNLIVGRSYGKKFYFVLTQGRNSSEIADTDDHELCHQLINRNKVHFCK